MDKDTLLEEKFWIDFLVRKIAERGYPPVFVVEEGTEDYQLLSKMTDAGLSERRRAEFARQKGIPVLDALEVVQHLRGEMDPEKEWGLRYLVSWVSAAKQGAVILDENDPDRLRALGTRGESPLASRVIPVDEIVERDLEELGFSKSSKALPTTNGFHT
ncbi:MAG: hypothetical protein M3R38_28535 [Actinomycetota bacterium]|nr:hypothetical protein [Actinomycetota bacterium]